MPRATDRRSAAVLGSPLFFAAAAAVIPIATASKEPDDDFYNAASQIIPVLLIALIVESRLADLWSISIGRMYGTAIVATLLVGELSALLEAGDIVGGKASLPITGAALVGGFAAVSAVAVVSLWLKTGDATQSLTNATSPAPAAAERQPD